MVLLVTVVTTSAHAEFKEVVSRDHDGDWHIQETVGCNGLQPESGAQAFEPGPIGIPTQTPTGGPPDGTGSLEFRTGGNGDTIEYFRNARYAGRSVSSITSLTYWTYVDPDSTPLVTEEQAVYVGLAVTNAGRGTGIDYLVFEPTHQESTQGMVRKGEWQRWSTGRTSGLWWLESSGDTVLRTLAEWTSTSNFPNASIINESATLGGVILGAGCGGPTWTNFIGNTDSFALTFSNEEATRFDFERETPGEPTHLNCHPETSRDRTGTTHSILCQASNDAGRVPGVEVNVEAAGASDTDGDSPKTPDFFCTTEPNGECTISHTGNGAGITTYRAWINADAGSDDTYKTVEADPTEGRDHLLQPGSRPEGSHPDGDDTDVLERTWTPARLDCSPETANASGSHTITCTARDTSNALAGGWNIDVEATGPNDPDNSNSLTSPDFTCNTETSGPSLGVCSVTHTPPSPVAGKTTYRAWIDVDNSNATSSEADTSEGVSTTGSRSEVDDTDVVEATWSGTTSTQSPAPTPTPCPTPSGVSPTPCPTPTPTPTPTPSSTPSPPPTPTLTPAPEPRKCGDGSGTTIRGTNGADILNGTPGDDTICGFGGNDTIRGRGGDDRLLGGRGDDSVFGGRGNDSLKGGAGNDELSGGPGRDVLEGGPGRDNLEGNGGVDSLDGGTGRDTCIGGSGRDRLRNCE